MLFYSVKFLVFFVILLLAYYLFPKKCQKYIVFIFNILFYFSFGYKPAALVFVIATIIYAVAVYVGGNKGEKIKVVKTVITAAVIVLITILAVLKYGSYAVSVFDKISHFEGIRNVNMLLPVGLSFFTFQSIGYLIDVYEGRIEAEKNYFETMDFLLFFPAILSGPILRAGDIIPQIKKTSSFDYERCLDGAVLLGFGIFQKLVIADRIGILVDQAYDNYMAYKGFLAIIVAVFYSLQIYFDFAGYSNMAIGISKMLSINVKINFDTPYFSQSISEFWRRWHISLSSWLKDYIYIPLGGNRKGYARKLINIMIVFFISGIWHGVGVQFVVWGLLHGIYQVIGNIFAKPRSKIEEFLHIDRNRLATKVLDMAGTFGLVSIAWIFFRSESLSDALRFIRNIFKTFNLWVFFDDTVYSLGINQKQMHVLLICIVIALIVDILQYIGRDVIKMVNSQQLVIRWSIYLIMIFAILVYGVYGNAYDANNFIYFKF